MNQLYFGKTGEEHIARWLRKRGSAVLPVYEKVIDEGKGPQIFMPDGQGKLVAPDMFSFNTNSVQWIEAKHKRAFSWHNKSGRWVTGIDIHHYRDYCRVDDETPWPVWLLFLHAGGCATNKDTVQPPSPSGLFGNSLKYLRHNENHRHDNWGKHGMVYWAIPSLYKIAEYNDVCNIGTIQ